MRRRRKRNKGKEEKKEGEAEQKKKKAQEGDEKLLLSVLGERIEGDGSDNADADETNNAGNSRTNKKFNYSGAGELELQLLEGTRF